MAFRQSLSWVVRFTFPLLIVAVLLPACNESAAQHETAHVPAPTPAPVAEVQATPARDASAPAPAAAPAPPQQAVTASEQSATNEGVGRLTVEDPVLDFGIVEPGARTRGEWTLSNVGDGPVHFDGRPGYTCGCSVPELSKDVLHPGESMTMPVTLTASRSPGQSNYRVWLLTKPPAEPRRLEMQIRATVRTLVETTPERWQFQLRGDAAENQVPLVLESTVNRPFRITNITVTGDALAINYDPEVSAVRHELPVKVDIDRLRATPNGAVAITTDHQGTPRISVQFGVDLPFVAAPPRKFFREITPGREELTDITIISNYSEEFEIGEVTSQQGLVRLVSVEPTPGGYKLNVAFSPPADANVQLLRDTLRVEIAGHPGEAVEVLFYGRIPAN